ncbi:rhamnan synthesis F family protein [Paracoccus benzoatiresistens]|uniref:Rhamnan synthesis protein F n=1 Tax=Paracoccus benzoatiresistens TaxID=2997341 RepID=A0ABT4J0A6_9RHOB|nr:rhamnan synthesis F family protein [Paracoccus sp. EF6]MCZ0960546.1 hypothetical protein [Paracoccus sp. EF6]
MMQKPLMPPERTIFEKLVRETKRLGRQFGSLVLPYWGHIVRLSYDCRRKSLVRVTAGQQSLQDELSILLIYQPGGLLDSTLWQIRWMAAQGVSTVVVSNVELSAADRGRLATITYLVVERPNVGYDFGGYREGVLQVLDRGIRPRALYLMNDSVWFPLSEDSDVLERSRAAPEDLWGLFVDLDQKKRATGTRMGSHVQSYFFRFSERLVRDPAFAQYWQKMSLVSSRRVVIQLRELRLTRHFANFGYQVGSLHCWKQVVEFLLSLDNEDTMNEILLHQCQVSRKDALLIEPLMRDGSKTALQVRDALRDKIARAHVLGQSLALHPIVMAALGFPFLKKQRTPIMVGTRAKMVKLGLHADYPEPIRREIETWDNHEVCRKQARR